MIPCPHCDRHIPRPDGQTEFGCPFCKGIVPFEASKGISTKVKIALGVGVAIAATIGAVKLFGDTVEPKFSPAYGVTIDEPVEF